MVKFTYPYIYVMCNSTGLFTSTGRLELSENSDETARRRSFFGFNKGCSCYGTLHQPSSLSGPSLGRHERAQCLRHL